MNVCPSARLRAGRMMSAAPSVGSAWASSSAKNGCRWPVCASRSTIGWFGSSELPMFVIGAAPVFARSRPGT